MKNKLLSLFLLLSATAFSQVSGYMGKRFTVGYSLSPMVSLPNDEAKVALVHSLGLSYVVGRRHEFVFNTAYSKKKDQPLEGLDHSSFSFSLALKIYSRARITSAPLGRYIRWDVLMNTNKISYPGYSDEMYDYQNNTSSSVLRSGGSVSYKSLGLAYGFGKQRIFFDNLVLDYGLRFGFTFPLAASEIYKNAHEGEIYDQTETFFTPFFNVRLGLGFLAF